MQSALSLQGYDLRPSPGSSRNDAYTRTHKEELGEVEFTDVRRSGVVARLEESREGVSRHDSALLDHQMG